MRRICCTIVTISEEIIMSDNNYAVFDMSRQYHFDDGEGNGVGLDDHVEYISNCCGTPDCGIFCSTLAEAFEEGKDCYGHDEGFAVVDLMEGKIIEVVPAEES